MMYPSTGPKDTLYIPGGMDCHMPQSSRGVPSTKIVAGSAGSVITRSEPSARKRPSTVVVAPATTSTSRGAGVPSPGTSVKATVCVPGAILSHVRPHVSRTTPSTRIWVGTPTRPSSADVVTRSRPKDRGSGPGAAGGEAESVRPLAGLW
ncbi:MAG: hypothetical protein ACT4OI_08585 [Methanobacteriota archaeon]